VFHFREQLRRPHLALAASPPALDPPARCGALVASSVVPGAAAVLSAAVLDVAVLPLSFNALVAFLLLLRLLACCAAPAVRVLLTKLPVRVATAFLCARLHTIDLAPPRRTRVVRALFSAEVAFHAVQRAADAPRPACVRLATETPGARRTHSLSLLRPTPTLPRPRSPRGQPAPPPVRQGRSRRPATLSAPLTRRCCESGQRSLGSDAVSYHQQKRDVLSSMVFNYVVLSPITFRVLHSYIFFRCLTISITR
jgi:hypothetical protein